MKLRTFYTVLVLALVLLVGVSGQSFAADSAEAVAKTANAVADVANAAAPAVTAAAGNSVVVADFDSGEKPNNIGGDFGSWDKDPNDETQGCHMQFESEDASGKKDGYSMSLDYDVDSPNPAYNGFWMKLNNFDATAYNTVNFSARGDASKGFTKRIKVELKDNTGNSPYILNGITDQWQKFSIPFEKFRRIKDWSKLTEFVIVFDDINSSPKTGAILIDDVSFSRQ